MFFFHVLEKFEQHNYINCEIISKKWYSKIRTYNLGNANVRWLNDANRLT